MNPILRQDIDRQRTGPRQLKDEPHDQDEMGETFAIQRGLGCLLGKLFAKYS